MKGREAQNNQSKQKERSKLHTRTTDILLTHHRPLFNNAALNLAMQLILKTNLNDYFE